jgi:hypothetical protein
MQKPARRGESGRVGTGPALRFGTPIRYLIMGSAAVDSPARAHKRIVDNALRCAPNGGMTDSLDEAKAAFRGAWDPSRKS